MKTLADTINDRLKEVQMALARRAAGEVVIPYISTGLESWDANGGILRGILTVIGGATGEGKTIVKLQLARAAAKDLNSVCMIDFEDPKSKTADREFSNITGINNKAIGRLDVGEQELRRLVAAARESMVWAGRIFHYQGLLDTESCFRTMEACECDLILIDYAQAFPEDEDRSMERTIADFAWKANDLAQRKNCAVVVFSQITREVEARGYRAFERARFRNPDSFDVSGFCPSGLGDIAWAKSLGERCKELVYIWRPKRQAIRLGAKMKDDTIKIISGKVNYGEEKDLTFFFDGATASIKEL